MASRKLPVMWEPTGRHVRVKLGGETIADSKHAMLLRDIGFSIHYFFPEADVRMDLLSATDFSRPSHVKGATRHWTVKAGGKEAVDAAWTFADIPEERPDTRGYLTFDWNAMEHWYEEEEEVFVHPRDPYSRVDTIHSTRHIRVEIEGVTVADTRRPVLLFETGLPTRYYIPPEDVHMDLLTPTATHTRCPYKGEASYWSVKIGDKDYKDVVWGYPDPISEIPKIKGLLSFYNEKLDIYVDGVLEERPRSPFS